MVDPLERVTNLLTLLLESRVPLTLQQIADQLGSYPAGAVAQRGAFERDKAVLRDIGVPIETEVLGGPQAGQTGYRIDRDRFELRGMQLDDDERHALQTAVAAVRSDVGQEGVWKLGGAVAGSSPVLAELPALTSLPALRTASSHHQAVSFVYHGTERVLDPYGLLLRNGLWYVIGHDHSRDAVRTFRVDRIEGEVVPRAAGTFEPPPGFDPRTAFPDDPKALGSGDDHAIVRVDGDIAPAVQRELGDDAVVGTVATGGGHAIELRVPCTNLDAFRSWLFGLGRRAEVVGPPEVRESVVTWLRAIVAAGAANGSGS
jgi:predicted DNA-binding transcriptional regulator YafY